MAEESDLHVSMKAQIDELTAKIETLATDLKMAKSQGFVGLIPCSMRLDVPRFSGADDPEAWIFLIEEYFGLHETTPDQRLRIVAFHLEGDAAVWFLGMRRNNLITTWDNFITSVRNRFGPSKLEDPLDDLSKLIQRGKVADYQSAFEKLMNPVTDVISESLLISIYISGLKPSLQRQLLISRPETLGEAFSLARVYEAWIEDNWGMGRHENKIQIQ